MTNGDVTGSGTAAAFEPLQRTPEPRPCSCAAEPSTPRTSGVSSPRTSPVVVDDETLPENPRQNDDFGKRPDERAEQVAENQIAVEVAEQRSSTVIDATQSTAEIADEIIRRTFGSRSAPLPAGWPVLTRGRSERLLESVQQPRSGTR